MSGAAPAGAPAGTQRISLASPLPGLEPLTDFTLVPVEGAVGLYSLDAVDLEGVRLFVLEAATHLPHYSPRLTAAQRELVGAAAPADVGVFAVVNTAGGAPAANLLAPLVVNTRSGIAAQVILEGQDWPVRHPLT